MNFACMLVALAAAISLDHLTERPVALALRSHPGGACLRTLRGGVAPLIIRIVSHEGTQRLSLESTASTFDELQLALQRKCGVPRSQQRLSRGRGGKEPFDADADASLSLRELGINHGAILHLTFPPSPTRAPPSASASTPAEPAASRAARQASRCRAATVQDCIEDAAQHEIVLKIPKPASCAFLAVDAGASKRFANYLLHTEFKERRYALLYGRWSSDIKGRTGASVDVFYEPPQVSKLLPPESTP